MRARAFVCAYYTCAAARGAGVRPAASSAPAMPPVGDVALSLFLFVVAGLMEVGGGWLVWQALREGSPAWHAVLGALVLAGYGFVPVAQPDVRPRKRRERRRQIARLRR